MKNKEVAEILYEIADFLEMQDVEYKPRAYRRAARNIEALSENISDIHERGELQDIDGVGKAIAGKIEEYLETGEMSYYQDLREDLPVDIEALTGVEGLGPKRVKKLYQELGIKNLDDLEEAAEKGEIADIEDFGEKTQQKILDHIEQARKSQERTLIGKAFPIANDLERQLNNSEHFDRVTIVGSFRRRRPTVGDIDILATAENPEEAMDWFATGEEVKETLVKGETKTSIVISGDLQVDLRIVDKESYGAALQYFTGSKDHNVTVRTLATKKDWKLNEYGLWDPEREKIAGEDEKEVYNELGLAYIEPEMREDTGEVEAAINDELPDLIEQEDIRGDLQMHTTFSDGRNSVSKMAEKADEKGYDYILLSDHGPSLRIASGIESEEVEEQAKAIEEANSEYDVTVLHGIEANIKDGELDITPEECKKFDLVVAALHDRVDNPTEQIVSVLEEYPVDILAHPQNRLINQRKPLELDLEKVMVAASENNVAIEINAQPERLDLDWQNVKNFRNTVKFIISTDAHSTGEMDLMHLGVSQARRGWCAPENILNTRSLEDLRSYFE